MATTAQDWRSWFRPWWWLLSALVVLVPLTRLWPLNGHFAVDWDNHRWLVGYTGEYLARHGWFPAAINTPEQAGMVYPVFYGTVFYPVLALFTAWLNPGFVLRLVIVVVTAVQLRLVRAAFVRIGLSHGLSLGVAALTIWTTYSLTNLYTRSALTEYVASGLLTSAVAVWFLLLRARDAAERRRLSSGLALALALVVGTHPITALYSMPIMALLLLAAFAEHGRDRTFWFALARSLVVPVLLALVVISPWLYALAKFKNELRITTDGGPFFYSGIDKWGTRFHLTPYDPRAVRVSPPELSSVSSPYLDAQLNMPLLLLMVGWGLIAAWQNKRTALGVVRSIAVPSLGFLFFVWISLHASAFKFLPNAARMLQLAYRAITYQNLALLMGVSALVAYLRRQQDGPSAHQQRAFACVLALCLALSAAGVFAQSLQVTQITTVHGSTWYSSDVERERWHKLPLIFYGYNAYTTAPLFHWLSSQQRTELVPAVIHIGTGESFGDPLPLILDLPADSWVTTNVEAFPWNKFRLDGADLGSDSVYANDIKLAVRVPAGKHVLTFRTAPPAIWCVMRVMSLAVTLAWFIGLAIVSLLARRGRRRGAMASPSSLSAG